MAKRRRLEEIVKETIDSVFEATTASPEGVYLSPRDKGMTESRIVTSLVGRKILEKIKASNPKGHGPGYKYRWVATMAPTKVLYGSIVDEIRDYNRVHFAKPKREDKPASPVAKDWTTLIEEIPDGILWEELKRRMWSIEDKRLVRTIKEYLD